LANEIVSYQATCLLFFDRTAAAWAVIASQLDVPAQSPEKTCAESLAGNVLLQLGEEAMVAGRPDDAEQWFHRLLRRLPTHKDCPNAATRLAEIAYDRGDFPEAAVRYEVVIARGDVAPENAPGLWYGLISSYSQNQQWDEVVDLAVKAKAKHSDWPCAYDFDYLRGRALFAKAELNDARAAFALVIAAPASTGTETGVLAHFMTAETYSLQNNLESALAEYELAAAGPIPEWQITGRMTCGKLREHLGRYEEAARDYERITRDHPDAPEAEDAERCRAACLAQAGVNKNLERK
jgi:tetratricopeptide (TPR) repeat protein